ncbi:DUF6445 family protein [Alteromonas sp. D210916BOD_24]|uniref:DUF6445 family protein n=1 Tax=Alteromonas sp. D210916BOD_24 TaxID=3157618 RepID=UPI00399C7367
MSGISTIPVPDSEYRVLIIDDFIPGPNKLIDYALSSGRAPRSEKRYPGMRMPVPTGYLRYALATINVALRQCHFSHTLAAGEAYFAMVTTPPSALTTEQRIPHFDRPYTDQYALVHYLCAPSFGGTSIYQYNPTGQIAVTQDNLVSYQQSLSRELNNRATPQGYINGSTDLFKQIVDVPCVFNRAVIYPCALLHSGNIPPDFTPDLNPYTGRFTVTAFFH